MTSQQEYDIMKWQPVLDYIDIKDLDKRAWMTRYLQMVEDSAGPNPSIFVERPEMEEVKNKINEKWQS